MTSPADLDRFEESFGVSIRITAAASLAHSVG